MTRDSRAKCLVSFRIIQIDNTITNSTDTDAPRMQEKLDVVLLDTVERNAIKIMICMTNWWNVISSGMYFARD